MVFNPELVPQKCPWMFYVACLGTNLTFMFMAALCSLSGYQSQLYEVRNTKLSVTSALGRVWDMVDAQ